jgi:hypothetical protein
MSYVHAMFSVRTLSRRVDDVLAMRYATAGSGLRGSRAGTLVDGTTFQGMASPTPSTTRSTPSQINADLQDVAHQVHQEFDDRLDRHVIDECLAKVAAQFADARVRSFVPLLVRRYVRDELQARL